MIWLYRALASFLALTLPVVALFNRKVRRGLMMRIYAKPIPRLAAQPLWIHAASGEFEYAKPLIRELKARHPQQPIVVTYFSPTFALSVENFPGIDVAMPLPLDLPGPCASFLRRVNPRALLIARTDFWPEMLTQARARHIPLHVFSFTQKALTRGKGFARWRTNLVDIIECVSEDDRRELSVLGSKARVEVGGDTRYDQVRYRLDHPKILPAALKPSTPCLVAGSTWGEDEHILLPALASLLREGKLKLILVPHEPTESHIETLRSELRLAGLTYALYSSQQSWDDKHVLLVDKVGVLAELYLWGDLAFVGGSYRKSVHSVMEALGAGCLTFVGPKHTGNREALEFKALTLPSGARPLLEAKDADQLRTLVESALSQATPKFKKELITEFDRRLGASQKLIARIGSFLET